MIFFDSIALLWHALTDGPGIPEYDEHEEPL